MYFLILIFLAGVCQLANSHNLTEKEILEFIPSEEMYKDFPYYLSGYDFDGNAIFIAEVGKLDFRKYIEGGVESQGNLSIFVDQVVYSIREIAKMSRTKRIVTITDLDRFDIHQAGSYATISFLLRKLEFARRIIMEGWIAKVWVINSNFLFDGILTLAKPILGSVSNVVEVYGSNKAKWKPKLLREIPRDQLPEWYGGIKDHKPVKIFG